MERDGLIQRERDSDDQRRSVVAATSKGLSLVDKLASSIEAHYSQMENLMGKTKLEQLYQLLDELISLEEPA